MNNVFIPGKNYADTQTENTLIERQNLLNAGVEEITPQELDAKLLELGYKLRQSDCFDYYNNYNEQHYKARCVSNYIDIKTGQSFAHFEQSFTNSANLEKLQKLRQQYFVFHKGRIWEM